MNNGEQYETTDLLWYQQLSTNIKPKDTLTSLVPYKIKKIWKGHALFVGIFMNTIIIHLQVEAALKIEIHNLSSDSYDLRVKNHLILFCDSSN